ncbi:class I SAM-dependent methyltransferase [Thetidibacter halocola]|uniref:Class I SAM-dependent methyltransferase n=1 Tax=Thetidibacter halocola TaxID=2827239 RepID=A0A8J8B9H8_9RHOB|nr:class I SAM-dependent methyltransferase [Thetidibacter halocola]MBS0125565.1 class I SAM-dependent methyltransferase [Thetidibacter halocola]
MTLNPYDKAGFHAEAIAKGRHRDVVGGRWDETGRAQMALLQEAGLRPGHVLLDIGAGALRLGCKAVPYLDPSHYWATDASRALMLAGRAAELPDPDRLPESHLVEDAAFDFPGVGQDITHAIAFAVFPHLPMAFLRRALTNLRRFDRLELLLFTVFLAPDADSAARPFRQPDGVVTHDLRPPYHLLAEDVAHFAHVTGWQVARVERMLPRGQVAFAARRT